jgi:putative Mg2+ transporter-C (MgtC) family protein
VSDADFVLNIGTALVLGTAIGLERQWRQHLAGLRTNTLVALGAAFFVSLSSCSQALVASRAGSPQREQGSPCSRCGLTAQGFLMKVAHGQDLVGPDRR